MVEIIVPSSGRAERIWDYTLGWLERVGFLGSASLVVAPDEIEAYEAVARGVPVLCGASGLNQNRRAAASKFSAGTLVLSIDDDLRDVVVPDRDRTGLVSATTAALRAMISDGFEWLEQFHGAMWGISPQHDRRHAADLVRVRVGAPAVEGCIYGFVSGRITEPDPDTMFDDVERVAATFSSGWNVVMLNQFSHVQSTSVSGGRSDRGRQACADVRRIEAMYPKLVEHKFGKLSGQHPCRPAMRPKKWVNDPVAEVELVALRERIDVERPRPVSTKIHQWVTTTPDQTGPVDEAIIQLRIALDKSPAFGRDDEIINQLRVLTQKHYQAGKPKIELAV